MLSMNLVCEKESDGKRFEFLKCIQTALDSMNLTQQLRHWASRGKIWDSELMSRKRSSCGRRKEFRLEAYPPGVYYS